MSNRPILLKKMEEILKLRSQYFTIRQIQYELREIKSEVDRLTIDEYVEILFLENKIIMTDHSGKIISLIEKKLQEYEKPLKILHVEHQDLISEIKSESSQHSFKEEKATNLNLVKINCIDFFYAILRSQFDDDIANNVFVKIYDIIDKFDSIKFFAPSHYSLLIFEQFFNKKSNINVDPESSRRNEIIEEVLKTEVNVYQLKEKVKALFDLFCGLNSTGYLKMFMINHKIFAHLNKMFFQSTNQQNIPTNPPLKKKSKLIKKKYNFMNKEITVIKNQAEMKYSDKTLYYTILDKMIEIL